MSVCPSVDQVNIFVQGRISRPINGSKLIFHMSMYLFETSRNIQEPWPIFHGPLTSDFGQIIKVKIFVQGRILSSTNGSKLIFQMRMYLYETSRNIHESWPIFHGLLTSDFGQVSMVKIFSSLELKAHRWAYSIDKASVICPSTFSTDISSEAMEQVLTKFHI